MRRRSPRLQVNTFPFLAVLLCAMGSLILVLLVMDRRAKIVGRHKAQEAARSAAATITKIVQDRKDEWERQRQAIHADLLRQHQALSDQVSQVKEKTREVQQLVEADLVSFKNCDGQLLQVKTLLAREQTVLQELQTKRGQEHQQAAIARTDLERLAREVTQLEQTLLALQALRQNAPNTYSLVPYKGRRGNARPPIYIECQDAGWIIHPAAIALTGVNKKGEELRRVVQQRLSRLKEEKQDAAPYLLMLVRPEGIENYYLAQAALQGLKLDFGYEFLDSSWVLDFTDEEKVNQPWRVAGNPAAAPLGAADKIGKTVQPFRHASPDAGSSPRETVGPPGGPSLQAGSPKGLPVALPKLGMGNAEGNSLGQGPGPSAGPSGISPGRPAAGSGTSIPPASQGIPAPAPWTFLGEGKRNNLGGQFPQSFSGMPGEEPTGWEKLATGKLPGAHRLRLPSEVGTYADRTQNTASSTETGKGPPAPNPGAPEEKPGSIHLGPPIPLVKERGKPPPPPLSRLLGNRDFIIVIECQAEAVVIHPGGRSFAAASLPARVEGQNMLMQAVQQLIARRQALVQPGEPPFRPVVKFSVYADGLAAYYRAYPLLEDLRLPMSRENVE